LGDDLRLDLLMGQVLPDARVLRGLGHYLRPTPLRDVFAGATHVRGLLSDLDHHQIDCGMTSPNSVST